MYSSTSIVLMVLVLLLYACGSTRHMSTDNSITKDGFYEKLHSIQLGFDSMLIDKYMIYSSVQGNCFGQSQLKIAKIFWHENDSFFCRSIKREENTNNSIDQTSTCNMAAFFNEFELNRIDTVTTFPTAILFIDPMTLDKIVVKCNDLNFEKSFDHFSFVTSKDTTHVLYKFLMSVVDE